MVEKRETATRPRSTARGDALTTPEQLFSSQLKEQERVKAPNAKTLTHRGLSALIADRLPGIAKLDVTLPADPVMQLTAQHPFDSKGLLDVYEPGRWDCSSDTIFMSPIDVHRALGGPVGRVCRLRELQAADGGNLRRRRQLHRVLDRDGLERAVGPDNRALEQQHPGRGARPVDRRAGRRVVLAVVHRPVPRFHTNPFQVFLPGPEERPFCTPAPRTLQPRRASLRTFCGVGVSGSLCNWSGAVQEPVYQRRELGRVLKEEAVSGVGEDP